MSKFIAMSTPCDKDFYEVKETNSEMVSLLANALGSPLMKIKDELIVRPEV